jgi:serine/threonine protein kinase
MARARTSRLPDGMVVTAEPSSLVAALTIMAAEVCSKMPQRQADDTAKKLLTLYTRLSEGQIRDEVCGMLAGLCNALAVLDQAEAESIQRALAQGVYDAGEDVLTWVVATQRLVQFSFRNVASSSSTSTEHFSNADDGQRANNQGIKNGERRLQQANQELQKQIAAHDELDVQLRQVKRDLQSQQFMHEKASFELKHVTKELVQERRKCEELENRVIQAHQELVEERRARAEAEDTIQQLQQQLQLEHSAREEAERCVEELVAAAPYHHHQSLMSSYINTASRSELATATEEFSQQNVLGRGGFGPVYSGRWRGRDTAIKVLDAASSQGSKEFLKEVNVLSQYQHPNLLPLIGFCISKEETHYFCALVYPRMRVSLEDALQSPQRRRRAQQAREEVLSASDRLAIALDAASGLAYLHSSQRKNVILHRDIKSSNILLDTENRARVSDVGLARPMEAGSSNVTLGIGTFGYIDNTYMMTGEFTPACDVFAFGVVMLELLTGEAATDSSKRPPILHARVAPHLPHDAARVSDPGAQWPASVVAEYASLAKSCVMMDASSRPTSQVVVERLSTMVARRESESESESQQPRPLERDRECLMCMNATRRTRLRPCCHVVFCEECADEACQRSMPCPVCRGLVQEYDVGDFHATFVAAA